MIDADELLGNEMPEISDDVYWLRWYIYTYIYIYIAMPLVCENSVLGLEGFERFWKLFTDFFPRIPTQGSYPSAERNAYMYICIYIYTLTFFLPVVSYR